MLQQAHNTGSLPVLVWLSRLNHRIGLKTQSVTRPQKNNAPPKGNRPVVPLRLLVSTKRRDMGSQSRLVPQPFSGCPYNFPMWDWRPVSLTLG